MSALDQCLDPDIGSPPAGARVQLTINVLGPVEVRSDNGGIPVGGPKPRALLAMLALDAGSTVSAERLIDGLWGDEPPPTAAKMVQLYVSQLRKAMAANGDCTVVRADLHGSEQIDLELHPCACGGGSYVRTEILVQSAYHDLRWVWPSTRRLIRAARARSAAARSGSPARPATPARVSSTPATS